MLRAAADALLSVVLAPSCAACGELLEHPTRGAACLRCWRSIRPLTPTMYLSASVSRVASAGAYEGALRAIVHAIKYEGRRSLARPLAALMRQRCGSVLEGADVLVPVPLHTARRRSRGFNQASDLARHLDPPIVHALKRTRPTASQTGLPAAERHRNMRGAFAAVWHAPDLAGKIVVLVDDVSTTGATIEACARVLKELGVREVRAVTAARVVMPPR
jgi:ComF family protein